MIHRYIYPLMGLWLENLDTL
ncbi:hypothetical protein Goklo_021324 [Gossypium klotzschianum]|uniref:Uncharacterized protein n=1 Tax=Gossypium klotzschianum TaxID=34286 RepID=A0A7J8UV26_9ROSI|nr:hypothetical protein [Gossypium klotzschianum]